MNGNKNLLVTCVYNNLYNSSLGGRINRTSHYTKSLATITKMNQDIVVYTSEEDKNILLQNDTIKSYDKIKFIIFDLYSDKNHNYYQSKKRELNQFNSDRCYEIMHNKVSWMNNHVNEGYDFIYWIDSGLSHGGLFPSRFRGNDKYENYFNNNLFTPQIFEKLNKINDKIVILGGNQTFHIFECSYSSLYQVPTKFEERYHIIGGFLGGSCLLVKELYDRYCKILNKMIELELLEREEHLLTLLFNSDDSLFHMIEFTTWHHEESDLAQYNQENEIYFYKIFENLN
jgi:hypothetical protein